MLSWLYAYINVIFVDHFAESTHVRSINLSVRHMLGNVQSCAVYMLTRTYYQSVQINVHDILNLSYLIQFYLGEEREECSVYANMY